MIRFPLAAAAALFAAATVHAQTVADVGLTVTWGATPVTVGQLCGPMTCAPIAASIRRGETLYVTHASAPLTPYALAIGFAGPCTPVPGIQGQLLLAPVPHVLSVGLTSYEPFVPTPCAQGIDVIVLPLIRSAPAGLVFRLQGIGISRSGPIAFGPAVEVTLQ